MNETRRPPPSNWIRQISVTAAHVPTSAVLEDLLRRAPADYVTLEWLIRELQERSFGIVMLLMALVALIPGGSIFTGVLLVYPATQMILARESPTMPALLAARRVSTQRLAKVVRRAVAVLKRMEAFIRPRWHTPFDATKRVIGVVVLGLAPTFIWPFPFSHVIPALVVMLLSLAFLERDGVLLVVGMGAALLSFAVTALTVWAGFEVTSLLGWF